MLWRTENPRQKFLEQMEAYLSILRESAQVFAAGINAYLEGDWDNFNAYREEAVTLERKADELIADINAYIYTRMLYPDVQRDISKIIKTLDDIIDANKQILLQISIEGPEIPPYLKKGFRDLTEYSCKTIGEIVYAARCFFEESILMEDHLNKVSFFESEADRAEEEIKVKLFTDPSLTSLAHKYHVLHFAEKIALIPDKAHLVSKTILMCSQGKTDYHQA